MLHREADSPWFKAKYSTKERRLANERDMPSESGNRGLPLCSSEGHLSGADGTMLMPASHLCQEGSARQPGVHLGLQNQPFVRTHYFLQQLLRGVPQALHYQVVQG